MQDNKRFATVITHMGRRKDIVEMPWLESEYHIEESDWMVLSDEGWRAIADGDPAIWDALKRKLLIGFYVSQPQLVVVIGHSGGEADEVKQQQDEVRLIAQRIRSLLLPAGVLGIWTDEDGQLQDILEPAVCEELEARDLELVH